MLRIAKFVEYKLKLWEYESSKTTEGLKMLMFNGKKYAKNDKEFADSLFSDNTCNGYYKKLKNGYQLFDMQKNMKAFLYANAKQGYFVADATVRPEGVWYSYGDEHKNWLGLSELTDSQYRDACKAAHLHNS